MASPRAAFCPAIAASTACRASTKTAISASPIVFTRCPPLCSIASVRSAVDDVTARAHVVAVLLPERRAVLDVGEEKRDGAARKLV